MGVGVRQAAAGELAGLMVGLGDGGEQGEQGRTGTADLLLREFCLRNGLCACASVVRVLYCVCVGVGEASDDE